MQKLEGAASRKVVQVVKLGPQNLGNLVTSPTNLEFRSTAKTFYSSYVLTSRQHTTMAPKKSESSRLADRMALHFRCMRAIESIANKICRDGR